MTARKVLNLAARIVETKADLAMQTDPGVKALLQQAIDRDHAEIGKSPLSPREHAVLAQSLREKADGLASSDSREALISFRDAMAHGLLAGDESLAQDCRAAFCRLRDHLEYTAPMHQAPDG